jgi:enoyl-CoA hydratase/carnithine racemase
MPQLSAGQIPWDGGTQRLPRLVGRSRALQIILTGETVDAWGALRIGLVNRVIQTSMLQATALDMAQSVSRMAPIAAEFAKEAILSGMELPLAHALRLETDLYFLLQNTIDRKEGIWAHREKRTPRFEGR